jgi:hypothetical protein
VPRTGVIPPYFGYSSFQLPDLNENTLNENVGVNSAAANTYKTRWFCPLGAYPTSAGSANSPVNWNCSGGFQPNVSADINRDGLHTTLHGYNDWGHLIYGGGSVGSPGLGGTPTQPMPAELTRQEAARID